MVIRKEVINISDLYVFDPYDKIIAILSNEGENACPFWEAMFKENLNNGSSFSFYCVADHEDAQYVKAENQVGFFDKDGAFRLFVIKEPERTEDENGPVIFATCEPSMNELNDEIIEDKRPQDKTAEYALGVALDGTRWQVGIVANLGTNSTNFYYSTATDAISNIINIWGGELRDRVEIDETGITGRYIDILARRGADTGKIWEIDKDILSMKEAVQSYPKTALYGRGASLEIEDENGDPTGGYTRLIDFGDIEWKVANGDPVDKPKGQKWVGDPGALKAWGRLMPDGSKRHRKGIYEDGEIEDPKELLNKTWEALQEQKKQTENFEMSVFLLEEITGYEHEKVRLGDTTIALNRNFSKPIEFEERVISFEYDVSDPDNTGTVEMGQFIDLFDYEIDEKLEKIQSQLNNTQAKANEPVTDDKIANIPPGTPADVTATGLFESILVEWGYNSAIYISNYEVYASQIKGFTPDVSNLVYRGKTSMYTHKAKTNELWYFRVRAINTHGIAGSFSVEVSAQTARLLYDDIDGEVKDGIDNARQQADDAVSKANQASLDAQQSITQAQNAFNKAQSALDTANDALDANSILSQKVDTNTKDISTLTQTASSLGTRISDAEGNISALQQTSSSFATRISDAEGNISSLTQTVSGLQTTVKNKADSSTVTQLAGVVDTKITKGQADGWYASQSQLTQTASSLQSTITSVQNNLDNLSIGDRNLLRLTDYASANINDIKNAYMYNSSDMIIQKYTWGNNLKDDSFIVGQNVLSLKWNVDGSKYEYYFNPKGSNGEDYITLEPNTDYTFSTWYYHAGGLDNILFIVWAYDDDGSNRTQYKTQQVSAAWTGNFQKFVYTFKTDSRKNYQPRLYFRPNNTKAVGTNADGSLFQPQIKKGNRYMDWSPSPLDMATQSQISQLANDINLRVKQNDVINQINISTEGILIDGKKVHITGETRIDTGIIVTANIKDAAIVNAKIANLAVDDSKIANLSVTKLKAGTLDANKITIYGGASNNYTTIDGAYWESCGTYTRSWRGKTTTSTVKIKSENGYLRARNDTAGWSLYFSDFGISTYADALGNSDASGTIAFHDKTYSDNALGLTLHSTYGVVGVRTDNNKIVLDANQTVNLESDEASIYIRPFKKTRPGSNVFNFWVKDNDAASDTDGVIHYGSENVGYGSALRFSKNANDPTIHATNGNGDLWTGKFAAQIVHANVHIFGDNTLKYVSGYLTAPSGSLSIGQNSVKANSITQTSDENYKKNIKSWDYNATEMILATSIRQFNYINESDDTEPHVGIILQEAPSWVIDIDKTGVEPYAMASLAWKAIQELSSENQDLMNQNQQLLLKIASLEDRLSKLEVA